MFKTRLISSIMLIIIMLVGIFCGNTVFSALFLTISLIGMYEFYKIFNIQWSILAYVTYLAAFVYDTLVYIGFEKASWIVIVLLFIALMMVYVISFPKYDAQQAMAAYFGFIYVAVMLSFVFRIKLMNDGIVLIWLVFICSWVNDTCAYLVGMLIGKHKMTPKLSPKKSVEGAIGGILGTAIVAAIYAYFFKEYFTSLINPILSCCVCCAIGAFISIFGDLCASAFKRQYNIKDYGSIIPGHGGVLDRFDSMIFIAPILYLLIEYLA